MIEDGSIDHLTTVQYSVGKAWILTQPLDTVQPPVHAYHP